MTGQRFRSIFEARGISKTKKIKEKTIGQFVVFGAAEEEVRDRFFKICWLTFGLHFESRAEKVDLRRVIFLKYVLGARRERLGLFLGCLLGVFRRCLQPQSQRQR